VIRALAEEYGISATPVREALQRLVAERLLVMLPNRSIAVPDPTIENFQELVRIRSALEGMAAEQAARNITAKTLGKLRSTLEDLDSAIEKHDTAAYLGLNKRFHFLIYEVADSPILLNMIQDLWVQVGPFFNRLFDDDIYVAKSNVEHERVYQALKGGNAEEAKAHIVKDIESAAEALLSQLKV
jgi:DNA-binding GntR family transcriptional regulator